MLVSLPAYYRSGRLIVTTGRLGERSLSRLLGVTSLPILVPKSRVAYLYMVMSHERECGLSDTSVEHHRAAVGTLARRRSYVWMIKSKALAKRVVSQCVVCRRERKMREKQQMGLLREEHLTVCPPWSSVNL